jgi:GntR family transcriptional regulator
VTQADVSIDFVIPPRRIAQDLQVGADEQVVKIERVTLANGTPIALMTNFLVPSIAPGIEKRLGGMTGLYSFLESEYSLVIEAATDFISARDVTESEARKLQIPEHSPLLVVRRITHSGGRPVEVAILLIVAEKYEYCVHTRDRPPRSAERAGTGLPTEARSRG